MESSGLVVLVALAFGQSCSGLLMPNLLEDILILEEEHSSASRGAVHLLFTNASRVVVSASTTLHHVSIANAPRLRVIEGSPTVETVIVGGCLLDRLEDSLSVFSAVSVLKLMRCQLKGTLDLALLFAMPALAKLNLERNRLERVVRTRDPDQPSPLTFLDLSGNMLESFDWTTLEPFTKLCDLVLHRNRLVSLVGEVRLPNLSIVGLLQNRLERVDLRGCDCPALWQMMFADNNSTGWPMFAPSATAIRTLDLNDNLLSHVNYTELGQHLRLEELMLNRNNLRSLAPSDEPGEDTDAGPLVELPLLSSLFLNNNHLDALELDRWHLPSLKVLSASFNPVHSLPNNLLAHWPQLKRLHCYCAQLDCAWIELHQMYVRDHVVELSQSLVGQSRPRNKNYHCIPLPGLGCYDCATAAAKSVE